MIFKRQTPLTTFILLLFLTALACQASTAASRQTTELIDTDAIVQQAVATVQAQTSEPILVTGSSDVAVSALDANLQNTLTNIYQRTNPSVVHIFVFSQLNQFNLPLGTGSGFVYDLDGHIITNNHVVAEGDSFEVVFADGNRRRATLVGTDVDSDLAVIKVSALPTNVQPVPLADSDSLEVGQFVVAIGNPFGEAGSMSIGIISGLGRTLASQRVPDNGGRYSLPQVIQTDAAINPGNSGGPLLNLRGEVIGVNSAILTRTGTNSGVGFSIPVEAVKRVTPAIVEEGMFEYPFIGISMADPLNVDQLEALDLPPNGVYVINVVPGTPAEDAGLIASGNTATGELLPGGDYILAVNGDAVKDSAELISYLFFETEIGETIDLTVLRNGAEVSIPLTLGVRP